MFLMISPYHPVRVRTRLEPDELAASSIVVVEAGDGGATGNTTSDPERGQP
jgi:hypothetical protein